MNILSLACTAALSLSISSCNLNRKVVVRDIQKINIDELESIEYLTGESINSFLTIRESLALQDNEMASEQALRAYVSALTAYHQLPDIVEKEQTLSPNGKVLDEKVSVSKSSTILVIKDVIRKSEDKSDILKAYSHLESAKLALVNGSSEQMIYHAEIAKKGLYFNMIEVDVEQIFLSSEDILFQVKRGQVEQAQIEIMRSVDHMKEHRQYNKESVLAH